MKARVYCEDKYEAQKLASLIYVKDSGETNIASILNAIENEIVISLQDGSAHSVLLRDSLHVEIFADFIQSVIDKEHNIIRATTMGDRVEIEKA